MPARPAATATPDLGPLLAAVTDQWEPALTISRRASIDPRTAGPRLAALAREGLVVFSEDRQARVRVYRRGPSAPPSPPTPIERLLAAARGVATAWGAWTNEEDGNGPFEVDQAVKTFREALNAFPSR